MSTSRIVVIRATATPESGFSSMRLINDSSGKTIEPTQVCVHICDLSTAERHELQRDPAVLANAKAIPTALTPPDTIGISSDIRIASGLVQIGADSSPFDGSGVSVAVLDTGIAAEHAAFAGIRLHQRDFTSSTADTSVARDEHGHGTHCAGILFGRDINNVRIGVARGVTDAMIGKVLDHSNSGDSGMLLQGLQWAIEGGANIICLSVQLRFRELVESFIAQDYSRDEATLLALHEYQQNDKALQCLVSYARARATLDGGSVILAASGNDSSHPRCLIPCAAPAALEHVISVGSVRGNTGSISKSAFSNIDCDVVAPGENVLSASPSPTKPMAIRNGTSTANPHAAGVAALWWQALSASAHPANAATVAWRLLRSAEPASISGYQRRIHGLGLIRAPQEMHHA